MVRTFWARRYCMISSITSRTFHWLCRWSLSCLFVLLLFNSFKSVFAWLLEPLAEDAEGTAAYTHSSLCHLWFAVKLVWFNKKNNEYVHILLLFRHCGNTWYFFLTLFLFAFTAFLLLMGDLLLSNIICIRLFTHIGKTQDVAKYTWFLFEILKWITRWQLIESRLYGKLKIIIEDFFSTHFFLVCFIVWSIDWHTYMILALSCWLKTIIL